MNRPKLGIIVLASRNEYLGEINQFIQFYQDKVPETGVIDIVIAPVPVFEEADAVNHARKMEADGINVILFAIGSWIFSSLAISAVNDLHIPFVLYGISGSIANGNLGAACQIRYVLEEMRKKFLFLTGNVDDGPNFDKVLKYVHAAWAAQTMRNKRIASIGGKCMMMYQTQVNEFNWKVKFGVDFPQYDAIQVFSEMENVDENAAIEVENQFLKRIKTIHRQTDAGEKMEEDAVRQQAKLYLAFKRFKELNQIDIFANKCMPEMTHQRYGFGYAACIATCLLNEDGIITACENDVPASLSMYILGLLSGSPVFFADIARVRKELNRLTFFNCGTAPISMADPEKGVALWPIPAFMSDSAVPQEYAINHMKGACIHFDLEENKTVTLFRIGGNEDTLRFHVVKATTAHRDVEPSEIQGNRWPGFAAKFEEDINLFLDNTTGHHYALVFGDWMDELKYLADILGVRFIANH